MTIVGVRLLGLIQIIQPSHLITHSPLITHCTKNKKGIIYCISLAPIQVNMTTTMCDTHLALLYLNGTSLHFNAPTSRNHASVLMINTRLRIIEMHQPPAMCNNTHCFCAREYLHAKLMHQRGLS